MILTLVIPGRRSEAEASPESHTPRRASDGRAMPHLLAPWLWIPGSRLRRAPE